MKKGLIVLCAMILIIASAIACWPRMAVQEDTTFALVCLDLDTRDVYVPLGAEDSSILRDILADALRLPDWTNTIPGQRFYYDDWHTCGILVYNIDGYNLLFVLPKQGSRHLLQVLGRDNNELIWLDATDLSALAAIFEKHGVFYPPVLAE